jgi:phosphoglycolate phosphatase-like HAD superfamily hydrolase
MKLAILTRASEKYTKATLEITKLNGFFTVIATRDDFTLLRAKPHQVALNYTINKLGVPPDNVLFIGDHELDYTCARQGDIRFIGVLGGAYDRTKLNGLPDIIVVENFHELGHLVNKINNESYPRIVN